jgi:hypothetical protein
MSEPSKARNLQTVKIRPRQKPTLSIEPTIAWQALTNVVKPVAGTHKLQRK